MSKNLNEVADNVKALSRMFKAVSNLADTVDEIGNLEQYKAEAEKQLATARLDLQGAQADLDTVKSQVTEQNGKLKTSKDAVASKIAEAEAEGDRIIKEATLKAIGISSDAIEEEKRLQANITELSKELKQLIADRELVLVNIEAANEKLAKIKAQATKLFED